MGHLELFFAPPGNITRSHVRITGEELHHLRRVLRKRRGDVISVADGEGNFYRVRLLAVTDEGAEGEILEHIPLQGELPVEITLAQALIKGQRFDWLVEKATELGVRRIIPVLTRYTIAQASPVKRERWGRIALSAMKQSGRSVLPEITDALPLTEALRELSRADVKLIAHEQEESGQAPWAGSLAEPAASRRGQALRKFLEQRPRHVALLVGPEGGFSPDELEQAIRVGFKTFCLGRRRLRSETASLMALSLISWEVERLRE